MKKALAAVIAATALGIVPATALAVETPNPHRFVGSPNAEPKFSGEGEEWVVKPFTVSCEKAKSTPSGVTPTFPSKTLTAVLKFSHCEAEALIGRAEYELKAKFLAPVTINYHANGYVEMGSGGTVKEGVLENAGPIEILVKGPFKCLISISPGTYPIGATKKPEAEWEDVKYTNQEETVEKGKKTELVKRLGISNAVSKMPYEIEEEFCEALPKTEFTNGQYNGPLVAEIKKGSIGWE
jgi:hypothetical protein